MRRIKSMLAIFKKENMPTILQYSFPILTALREDGLAEFDSTGLRVTALGSHFTRNICRAFDLKLLRSCINENEQLFSRAI